uniref:Uncharacterized protein n=1 Tax=Amphiprion percula TaxID=161767 RepID=A0A3P8SMW7_AMPPE
MKNLLLLLSVITIYLLATGGMDRLIRLWNPHFSGKPTGVLKGHSAPIIFLCISSEDSQIFSVSNDNTVKIWHIEDQCCLFTADPKESGIHGDISACSYSPAVKCLYVAADCLAMLSLKPRLHSHLMASHNEPVMCCGFSEEFRQVVSCTEGSVVKVWDFDSGHQVFEFGGTHDLSSITCMTFDLKGRRLITGGTDGCLKIWNFNNGQCLKTLKKGDIPEDSHHVQKPQPSWQDDLKNGHKDDILCIAQCPPSLLATSSYNGEIIVWNVISGRIQCRLVSPLAAQHQNAEGNFQSFKVNKESNLQISYSYTSVLKSFFFCVCTFQSKFQQKITKMAKTDKDMLLYAADRIGYIYVYSIEKFAPEQISPRVGHRCREMISNGFRHCDILRSHSFDCVTFIQQFWSPSTGTFGQPESWNVHISSSWMHPGVPFEVLIDPLSMPDNEILNAKSCHSDARTPGRDEADRGEVKSPCFYGCK